MAHRVTINFDGLAAPGNTPVPIEDGYAVPGMVWQNMGAEFVSPGDQDPNTGDGYGYDLHSGDSVGFTIPNGSEGDGDGFVLMNKTFSAESVWLAAAWDRGLKVIFTPIALGGARLQPFRVVLNQHSQQVHFPARFNHIKAVDIETHGGHDANHDDLGTGTNVVVDDLVLAIDRTDVSHHHHHVDVAAMLPARAQTVDMHSLAHWALA